MVSFRKATRTARKARISFNGPAGSGKTRSALELASRLGRRVAVIDTEHQSADTYAPEPGQAADPSRGTFDFDSLGLSNFAPTVYMEALWAAAEAGYDVVVIDSLSHAWMGEGGILSQADAGGKRFDVWKDLTPQQNKLMETILSYPGHVIVTMRTKTVYEVTKTTDQKGKDKTRVEKIGTAPVQKEGMEYEFDVVIDMDLEHNGSVTKTRCSEIEGKVFHKPGAEFAAIIKRWLDAGGEAPKAAPAPVTAPEKSAKRIAAEATLRTQVSVARDLAAQLGIADWSHGLDAHAATIDGPEGASNEALKGALAAVAGVIKQMKDEQAKRAASSSEEAA